MRAAMLALPLLWALACGEKSGPQAPQGGEAPATDLTAPSAALDLSGEVDLARSAVADLAFTSDGGACVLKVSFKAGACDACVQASCCDVVNACYDDPSCMALFKCEASCLIGLPTPTCHSKCEAMYPAQVPTLKAAEGCPATYCQSSCVS